MHQFETHCFTQMEAITKVLLVSFLPCHLTAAQHTRVLRSASLGSAGYTLETFPYLYMDSVLLLLQDNPLFSQLVPHPWACMLFLILYSEDL